MDIFNHFAKIYMGCGLTGVEYGNEIWNIFLALN